MASTASRQKSIKDYFSPYPKRRVQRTTLGTGYSSLLQDLPNELLLLIMEYIRLQDPLHNHARELSLVCKRFHYVYNPLALELVRLKGVTNIRNFKKSTFSKTAIKTAVISYKAYNVVTMFATLEQLVPVVREFTGLTTIVLTCVLVSFELLEALGTLLNLNSLTYDTPYPYDMLGRVTRYGHFDAEYLKKNQHLLPRNLREVSFKLCCSDHEVKALNFLLSVLAASSETLASLTVDLQALTDFRGLRDLFNMHFPALSMMWIYYADPRVWVDFRAFCFNHLHHLKNIEILFYMDGYISDDADWMGEIPGFEDGLVDNYLGRALLLMRSSQENQERDGIAEAPGIILEELALEHCTWTKLKTVGKRHPMIRVLNAWDSHIIEEEDEPKSASGSDSNSASSAPSSSENDPDFRLPLEEISLIAPYFSNLEVLRFNASHHGLPLHSISKPFPICRLCGASATTDAYEQLALAPSSPNLDDHIQRICEWEETEWPIYQETVYELASYFPNLQLVEWFLAPFRWSKTPATFAPFWSWKIQRREQNMGRPTLSRSLHDTAVRPFDPIPSWNLMRGFSLRPDRVVTDYSWCGVSKRCHY